MSQLFTSGGQSIGAPSRARALEAGERWARLVLTQLRPERIVRVCLGQHVDQLRGAFLREGFDGWVVNGHDGGYPGQVVG